MNESFKIHEIDSN